MTRHEVIAVGLMVPVMTLSTAALFWWLTGL